MKVVIALLNLALQLLTVAGGEPLLWALEVCSAALYLWVAVQAAAACDCGHDSKATSGMVLAAL